MSVDITLPVSIPTKSPEVELDPGRKYDGNQSVNDQRQAFNQEYQRQVEAQKDRQIRDHTEGQRRQKDAQQDSARADLRAEKQADQARRLEQDRRAERSQKQRESGKPLPDQADRKPRSTARDQAQSRAQSSDQRQRQHEEARSQSVSRTSEHSADQTERTQADRTPSPSNGQVDAEQTATLKTASADPEPVILSSEDTSEQDSARLNETSEQVATESSEENANARVDSNTDTELSPYFQQQLTDASASTEPLETALEGDGESSSNPLSSLEQWMRQTLGSSSGASAIAGEQEALTSQSIASAQENGVSAEQSRETSPAGQEVAVSNSQATVNVEGGDTKDPLLAQQQTSQQTSQQTLQQAKAADAARLLEAKLKDAKASEKELAGAKVLPLSQAIEAANRSDKPAEPTFLKQASLTPASSESAPSALSLDEIKQMMQERKALLEGAAANSKGGGESAMTPEAEKLMAVEKRLSDGMEGLKQLRIPGNEAKKPGADDKASSLTQTSFGRTLEQMSTVKMEEGKALSTSISTHPNKPGFVPEVNQRLMMMIGQKIQSAEIRLNPEELGTIDVSIKFNQEQQASVVFASQNAVTREALENGAQRLRDMLDQNGVELESVDIQEGLAQDRHDQASEGENELASQAAGGKGDGSGEDESAESDKVVDIIESDSLVDFYA